MANIFPADPVMTYSAMLSDAKSRFKRSKMEMELVDPAFQISRISSGYRFLIGEVTGVRLSEIDLKLTPKPGSSGKVKTVAAWRADCEIVGSEEGFPACEPATSITEVIGMAETAILHGLMMKRRTEYYPGDFIKMSSGIMLPVHLIRDAQECLWQVLEIAWSDDEMADLMHKSGIWRDLLITPRFRTSGLAPMMKWIGATWAPDVGQDDTDLMAVAQERLLDDGFTYRAWPNK